MSINKNNCDLIIKFYDVICDIYHTFHLLKTWKNFQFKNEHQISTNFNWDNFVISSFCESTLFYSLYEIIHNNLNLLNKKASVNIFTTLYKHLKFIKERNNMLKHGCDYMKYFNEIKNLLYQNTGKFPHELAASKHDIANEIKIICLNENFKKNKKKLLIYISGFLLVNFLQMNSLNSKMINLINAIKKFKKL